MDNGEVESESSSDDEMPPLEDCSYMEMELYLTRHALSIKPKENGDVEQREHIFHTRCLVQGKVCSMILDGGSCTNVASTILVEKINLKTAKHPRSYKLQWLSNIGEVKVDNQVSVPFAIENYKDEVLCDVVLMEVGHILLGHSWQLDRKVTHKGYTNCLSFIYNEFKITLTPLSLKQVCEDQLKMRKKKRKENMSENKQKKEKHEIECSEEKSKKMSAFAKKMPLQHPSSYVHQITKANYSIVNPRSNSLKDINADLFSAKTDLIRSRLSADSDATKSDWTRFRTDATESD
ncbi:hypothetical protein CR513_12546, partial [Mucuna pruriens]